MVDVYYCHSKIIRNSGWRSGRTSRKWARRETSGTCAERLRHFVWLMTTTGGTSPSKTNPPFQNIQGGLLLKYELCSIDLLIVLKNWHKGFEIIYYINYAIDITKSVFYLFVRSKASILKPLMRPDSAKNGRETMNVERKKTMLTEHLSTIVRKFVKLMSINNGLNREKVPPDATSSGREFRTATTPSNKTFLVMLVGHFFLRTIWNDVPVCSCVIGKL